jgi:hypothetical protein
MSSSSKTPKSQQRPVRPLTVPKEFNLSTSKRSTRQPDSAKQVLWRTQRGKCSNLTMSCCRNPCMQTPGRASLCTSHATHTVYGAHLACDLFYRDLAGLAFTLLSAGFCHC